MKFFECPYSLKLGQEWEYVGEEEDNPGSSTHLLFKEGKQPDDSTTSLVKLYYNRLAALEKIFPLTNVEREVRDEFDLDFHSVRVHVTRILDVKGTDSEGLIALDYKTAKVGWNTLVGPNGFEEAPQAHTFQAATYVLPKPGESQGNWPERIFFLVAPIRDRATYFGYHRNTEDTLNLMHALEYAAMSYLTGEDGPCSILNRGRACDWCSYNLMCWDSPGWSEVYKKRGRK